jgi:sirohydrochlorin cobaltochelatase
MPQLKAVVLFGHGSRDPLWRQPMEAVAARLAAKGVQARCAYLELNTPDLPTCVRELVGSGARSITIVPMFLGTGKHAREDLPLLVKRLRGDHLGVMFNLQQAVGEDSRVLDLLATIALE